MVWPNEAMVKTIIPAGQGVFLPVMDIKVKENAWALFSSVPEVLLASVDTTRWAINDSSAAAGVVRWRRVLGFKFI